ncbi:MAG: hypothetical protein KatS3mg104_2793 [Phycisphaerae bacterium]|nr:MAG: hypothetical protein KatS3mg104_2793 [Phycisphaerae bacterium]
MTDTLENEQLVLNADPQGGVRVVKLPEEAQIIHTFWFAWAAFHLKTDLYTSSPADQPHVKDAMPLLKVIQSSFTQGDSNMKPSNEPMNIHPTFQQIQERAFAIYLAEDCPQGRCDVHWPMAEEQLRAELRQVESQPLLPNPASRRKSAQVTAYDFPEGILP